MPVQAILIGCTNQPAELGIPRTQAGQAGSGPGARRPSSRATASSSPCRPRTYAVDLRHHRRRDPHDPLITRGSPFANFFDQKHNITSDIPPSQSRPVRAQF
jgi:hypothetical protein